MSGTRAWQLFGQLCEQDPTTLSDDQRLLVAVAGVRQEVNSGGLDRYFRYSYGGGAETVRDAARNVGCGPLAALMTAALDRLGLEPYTKDSVAREARIDGLDISFDDLDNAFYDLERNHDLDELMESIAERIPR